MLKMDYIIFIVIMNNYSIITTLRVQVPNNHILS